MTRQISLQTFFLLSAVFIAIGVAVGSGITYDSKVTQEIVEAQDEEKFCNQDKTCVEWLTREFVPRSIYDTDQLALQEAIKHPHIEIPAIQETLKIQSNLLGKLSNDMNQLKLDMAKLKTEGTGNTPTPTGSIILSLDQSSYERGEVVVISGSATPNTQITSSIYLLDPGEDYTPTGQSLDDGQFYIYWVTPSDIPLGTYTAIIKDTTTKKTGKISVIIK